MNNETVIYQGHLLMAGNLNFWAVILTLQDVYKECCTSIFSCHMLSKAKDWVTWEIWNFCISSLLRCLLLRPNVQKCLWGSICFPIFELLEINMEEGKIKEIKGLIDTPFQVAAQHHLFLFIFSWEKFQRKQMHLMHLLVLVLRRFWARFCPYRTRFFPLQPLH